MTRPIRRPRALARTVAIGIAALALVAGCDRATALLASAQPPVRQGQTGAAIQIGAGTGQAGPWNGWLYPTADGACVDVTGAGAAGEASCQGGSQPFEGDIGVGARSDGTTVWAWGSSALPDAAVAAITLHNGEMVRIPLVRPAGPVANGNGYFMARFEPDQQVDLIVLLDGTDRELDRYPMGR